MMQLIQLEMFKLKHSKGFRVLLVLLAILGVFGVMAASAIGEGTSISGFRAFYKQFEDMKSLIFVCIGLFSGFFIGEDFSNRSLQAEVAFGHSRFSILFSKSLIMMLGVVVMIGVELAVATVGATLVNGFGATVTWGLVANLMRSFFMFAFLMCAASMICIMTAFLIKNKGTVLAVNVLLLVLMDGLVQLLASQMKFGVDFYRNTLFFQVVQTSSAILSGQELMKGIFVGLMTLVCFFSITYGVFRRSELK